MMSSRGKIYIAGKISGLPIERAMENFSIIAFALAWEGYEPVNPFEVVNNPDAEWSHAMKLGIKALMDCNAIFMMENWKDSLGARIEHNLAMALGIQIIYEDKCSFEYLV